MKLAWIGLTLLVAAGLAWFALKPSGSDESQAADDSTQAPKAKAAVRKDPTLNDDSLFIPEEEEEQAQETETETKKPKRRTAGGGSWDCSGEISVAAVRTVIGQNRGAVQRCYEHQLRVDNTLQGTLQVQLRIGEDGKVSGVRTGGSLRNPKVSSCVKGLARRWSFPSPTAGNCAVIAAPFSLSPSS